MVTHTCDPCAREVAAGGSVQVQPGLHETVQTNINEGVTLWVRGGAQMQTCCDWVQIIAGDPDITLSRKWGTESWAKCSEMWKSDQDLLSYGTKGILNSFRALNTLTSTAVGKSIILLFVLSFQRRGKPPGWTSGPSGRLCSWRASICEGLREGPTRWGAQAQEESLWETAGKILLSFLAQAAPNVLSSLAQAAPVCC